MRSILLTLLVLAAAGGLTWYLIGGAGDGGGGAAYDDASLEEGEPEAGPGLTAAGTKRVRAPAETRGEGWIQGTVKRGDAAVAAEIELRHVETIDPRNPFGSGLEMAMIARMLDSGVSVKEVLKATSAGPDGTYSFRGLAPGRYEVRATTADGAMGFAKASLPAHGARVQAAIEIPVGNASLAGRAVHADGRAYRGLVVLSNSSGMEAMLLGGGDVRPAYTDADGRFKFGGLVPGKVSISAIVPGVMRVMGAPLTVPHDGEYVLTIGAGGLEMKGRVISAADESAIAGAVVFGGGGDPSTSFSIRSTKTDADGRFALRLPAGGGGGMIVQAAGYAPQNVNVRNDAAEEITVTMVALGRIVGRVVTQADGSAVAGVTIFAGGASNRGGMPNMSSTVTDADGRYVLDNVAPGQVGVHALGAGWVSVGYSGDQSAGASPYAAEVEPGETSELDLEVIPGAKAAGRVATAKGEAVVGAVVQASGGEGRGDLFVALLGLGTSFGATVTDEQGRYEIDVLAPGSNYKITAQAPDHPDAVSETFTADAGKTIAIDLLMTAPRYLTVRVVDVEGGSPVVGANVALQQGGGTLMDVRNVLTGGGTRTDAKGLARVGPLGEGKFALSVTAPGYVKQSSIEVEEMPGDAPTMTVELTRGLVIAGRVTMPADVPVGATRLTIRRDGGRDGRGWFYESAPVAADGTFRLDTLEERGAYKLQAQARFEGRSFRAELEVDAGSEDIVLALKEQEREAAGTLVVNVIDVDGKPVPSGRAILRQHQGNSRSSNYSNLSGGKVTFQDVKPDAELWLEIHDLIGNRGALIHGPFRAGVTEIELRLPASLVISGRVLGPDGKGVRGVRVAAQAKLPVENHGSGNEHGTGVSDGDGNFEVKGLGEIEYELRFKAPKAFAPVPPQAASAGARDIVVTLRAGVEATLTVLDYEGKPLPGAYASVQIERKDQPGWRGGTDFPRADQDGMIRLRGLDPDATFLLTVSGPQAREDLKPLRREGWRPVDETIKLARGWRISGVVKDQNGQPAEGVWVRSRLEGAQEWGTSAHTDDQGRFELRALDAGRYEVQAEAGNVVHTSPAAVPSPGGAPPVARPESKVVRAGAQNVMLTIDTGQELVVRVRDMPALKGRHPTATLRSKGQASEGIQTITGDWDGRGRVTFKGLRPELAYTLWIVGIPGNAYVHVTDVRAQSDPLEVDSKAGRRITGRVRAPQGVAFSHVGVGAASRDGFNAQGQVDPKTGNFEIAGLPAGHYYVNAYAWSEGKSYHASGEADTGAELELVLTSR